MAAKIKQASELWEPERHLTQRWKEIDRKYECNYSVPQPLPTAGSTIQLFAAAFDQDGLVVPTSFIWTSDSPAVATVNSGTPLVTGVANGICNIKAQANDSGAAKGSIAVGTTLLSSNTLSWWRRLGARQAGEQDKLLEAAVLQLMAYCAARRR